MMILRTKARLETALRSSVSVPRNSSFAEKRGIHPEGYGFRCFGNEMPIPATMAGVTLLLI
jgi:hypothetical protein